MTNRLPTRSQRKHEAILEAATQLFLENGYAGTSMEHVAAAAGASKQTIYKHFSSKKALFEQITMATVVAVSTPFQERIRAAAVAADVPAALRGLARDYLLAVTAPLVLRRRRLVVREAGRLPDLARTYHDATVGATIRQFAATFTQLTDRGALNIDDPDVAAAHFAFLVVGQSLDAALFGADEQRSAQQLAAAADRSTDVFLAAYAVDPST